MFEDEDFGDALTPEVRAAEERMREELERRGTSRERERPCDETAPRACFFAVRGVREDQGGEAALQRRG